MRSLAAVVLVQGRRLENEVIDRALAEGIVFLGSDDTAFDLVGKLYELGLRSGR